MDFASPSKGSENRTRCPEDLSRLWYIIETEKIKQLICIMCRRGSLAGK